MHNCVSIQGFFNVTFYILGFLWTAANFLSILSCHPTHVVVMTNAESPAS